MIHGPTADFSATSGPSGPSGASRESGLLRLLAAVQELSLARDVASIQAIVRRAARDLTGADGATFVLRDVDRCYYADEDAISPLWKGQRFPMTQCISGWVMNHASPVVIPDIFSDPRIPVEAYRPTFVKSLAMVPIRTESPIGAIGNYWARHHKADPGEVELLQALANTTAVAMENVRVYAELEERVRQRTTLLEQMNRELEAFSYSVSHDLRAPLRVISGFAEFAHEASEKGKGPEAQQWCRKIVEQSARMNGLIEDLLRLSKIARADLHLGPVDLSALARETAARLAESDKTRQVRWVLDQGLAACGDRGLLMIVMENLLSNAWKYSAKVPVAEIEFGRRGQADGLDVYFVKDNGAGFDMRYTTHLFAPFQRLHTQDEFPGVGVGLATVQRIIHRHGGRIWPDAELGRGATFFFTLPTANSGSKSPF